MHRQETATSFGNSCSDGFGLQDFVSFLKNWAVATALTVLSLHLKLFASGFVASKVKHHESKHLVSHNAQNTTCHQGKSEQVGVGETLECRYRFKRTTCVPDSAGSQKVVSMPRRHIQSMSSQVEVCPICWCPSRF